MNNQFIHIEGARQHNLKNLTIDIPRNRLVVICGPSGSGKSTLAFDLIYAEGQRRYVESLSAYARQFLPKMDKPLVDKIEGLSPAISLEQQSAIRTPRSTVGTTTEIHDFLRIFFARLGQVYCPDCNLPIESQTPDEIINHILELPEGTRFLILAPLVEHQKGSQQDLLRKLKGQGFSRVRVNGEIVSLEPLPELDKKKKHRLELVIDRLQKKEGMRRRLADSVELALTNGEGGLILAIVDGEERFLSTQSVCPNCRRSMPAPSPQLFSFNAPQGACPECMGIGSIESFEPLLIAPNKGLSLRQGAIIPWRQKAFARWAEMLENLGRDLDFDLDTPLGAFSEQARAALFYGRAASNWPGVIPLLEKGQGLSPIWHDELARFRQSRPCPACHGARLRPEALAVRVADLTIESLSNLSIDKALTWISALTFQSQDAPIAEPLLKELKHRLTFLVNVGLDYITLSRSMATLSGGEAQRIRLASQLGSGLVGVTYVLDEPSIGLHPKDNERLLGTLRSLQSKGNTVLVVEHDEATIRTADHILEMGPASGLAGGEIVFSGSVSELLDNSDSLTARYLRRELTIPKPLSRRGARGELIIHGARANNLKNLTCSIPLGTLTCVTGPSGSGKSSLVVDTLYKHLALAQGIKVDNPGPLDSIAGAEQINRIIAIDQTPIGRTPRSNPATYTKIFDEIRDLFAKTKDARERGYKPGRFSFNVSGGRCEACRGDGMIKVEMHFLPDVYVLCDACKGKRYNLETLEVRYKGLNIDEVLNLTISEARQFFTNFPALARRLEVLEQVGLGYLTLGQPATTLSGGEAQRIKISRELGKRGLPGTMYILDEPTTGLHMHEVGKLIQVLQSLVDKEATVVVIEHNPDIILAADQVIDLGPGGGEYGGTVTAQGTPEEIMENPASETGRYLKNDL